MTVRSPQQARVVYPAKIERAVAHLHQSAFRRLCRAGMPTSKPLVSMVAARLGSAGVVTMRVLLRVRSPRAWQRARAGERHRAVWVAQGLIGTDGQRSGVLIDVPPV